ncbi:MAG: DUF3341 domain-containing protein [Rhodothermaceae bacterium]|nr:DUF3341 domain-containing protein [Rhodothermaceae bacterium]
MLKNLLRSAKANMSIYESNDDDEYGLLAEFSNPATLMHAAEATHKAGYKHFDTHSPFPIHGMDKAMGLSNSRVGYICLLGGITGLALATWLQWWTGSIDYPLNISGKPFFAIEPSVPVMFELTVLLSAYAAVIGMLAFNGLPRPYNPLFYSKNFARASDDAFFLFVATSDEKFDKEKTTAMMKELGSLRIEMIKDQGSVNVGNGHHDDDAVQLIEEIETVA